MMISLWLSMAVLLLVAAAFFLWPLRSAKRKQAAPEDRRTHLATNVALFREHLAELEQARASGRLTNEAFEQLKLEQERALLEDQEAAQRRDGGLNFGRLGGRFLVAVSVAALSLGVVLYFQWGSSQDVRLQQLQQEKMQLDMEDWRSQREPDPERTRELIKALEDRLEDRPDNLQYRFMLARNAMALGDHDRAIEAYEAILSRDPESPRVLAELAQALFLRDGNRINPRIAGLARSALQLDPEETTALGLAGIDAFQKGDHEAAIGYWQRAVEVLGPHSPSSRALQGGIERARRELAEGGGEPPVENDKRRADSETTPDEGAQEGDSVSVTLEVSVGDEARVSPDQWVFIYARAWQGSPMPLAINRIKVAELPKTIILDDTMAMSANASLSQADQVELVARVSQDGTAAAKPGDWQGSVGPVDPRAQEAPLALTIDRELTE